MEFCVRVSGTDVDWRHDMQNETPRHDRACHATTPKYMTARARQTTHKHTTLHGTPRHGVVAHLFARVALQGHL